MDRVTISDDVLRAYLMERRRVLITELRALERMLGVKQSIPPKDPHT